MPGSAPSGNVLRPTGRDVSSLQIVMLESAVAVKRTSSISSLSEVSYARTRRRMSPAVRRMPQNVSTSSLRTPSKLSVEQGCRRTRAGSRRDRYVVAAAVPHVEADGGLRHVEAHVEHRRDRIAASPRRRRAASSEFGGELVSRVSVVNTSVHDAVVDEVEPERGMRLAALLPGGQLVERAARP